MIGRERAQPGKVLCEPHLGTLQNRSKEPSACLASSWGEGDAMGALGSSRLENCRKDLWFPLHRGLTVLSWNRNQEGAIVGGVGRGSRAGREQRGPERPLICDSLRETPLPAWGRGFSPFAGALWPPSTGSSGLTELQPFAAVVRNSHGHHAPAGLAPFLSPTAWRSLVCLPTLLENFVS